MALIIMMKKMVKVLNQRATGKRVLLLLCTSAILGVCIVTMFFGLIRLIPEATMDSLTYYSGETFYDNLEIQGPEGRKSYLLLHLIDYLFMTQFYFLFAFLIIMLLRKIPNRGTAHVLCLLPLFSGAMDFFENLSVDISIIMYPKRFLGLGYLSGVFTFLKMYSLYAVFLIIVVLSLLVFINVFKKGKGLWK